MHETVPVVGKSEERGERAARPFLGRAPRYFTEIVRCTAKMRSGYADQTIRRAFRRLPGPKPNALMRSVECTLRMSDLFKA